MRIPRRTRTRQCWSRPRWRTRWGCGWRFAGRGRMGRGGSEFSFRSPGTPSVAKIPKTNMSSETDPKQSLSLPGVLRQDASGQVYLEGHRITLYDVVTYYNEGLSAEMLVGQFPTLPLALVHKVIAFYLEHADAVDCYVAHETQTLDKQRASAPPGVTLEELRRRLRVARAG